jgi:hypothetical protein
VFGQAGPVGRTSPTHIAADMVNFRQFLPHHLLSQGVQDLCFPFLDSGG